jgi:hypothetical protein
MMFLHGVKGIADVKGRGLDVAVISFFLFFSHSSSPSLDLSLALLSVLQHNLH